MKYSIKILSFLSFTTMIVCLFFSCAKESILPSNELSLAASKQAIVNDVQAAEEESTEQTSEVEGYLNLNENSLQEVLSKINFDAQTIWGIDIQGFTCFRSGESLVVYNPNVADLDFYDSRRFAVYWFKDGKPLLLNSRTRLECVCKGEYTAIVLNRRNQTAVGMASYEVRACFDPDPSTIFHADQ